MKSGKTYQANKLISAVRKTNVLVLDSHNEYLDFPLRVSPSRPHNVEVVNRLVDTAYSYAKDKDGNKKLAWKVVVFDDLDLYVRHDRESQSLADIFIDGRHYKIGCLILAKRCVNLDVRVLQACKYIYVFKGTIMQDYERIAEQCSFDLIEAGTIKLDLDKSPNEHAFILMDNVAKKCRLLSDVAMTASE